VGDLASSTLLFPEEQASWVRARIETMTDLTIAEACA
jgi:hypothetical protein